jgi:hypothetical protein
MEYSLLGPTGVKVSKICLGTATVGRRPTDRAEGRQGKSDTLDAYGPRTRTLTRSKPAAIFLTTHSSVSGSSTDSSAMIV